MVLLISVYTEIIKGLGFDRHKNPRKLTCYPRINMYLYYNVFYKILQIHTDCVNMDKPAVFIGAHLNGQLIINEEMVKLLSQISNQVTVISIVGEFQLGCKYG